MEIVTNKKTCIIGIGASAGGLEALNDFFDHTSTEIEAAFIVVQHLSSRYKSLLVELVGKHTHMSVCEARHGDIVTGGNVYIIPNDKELTIARGILQLLDKGSKNAPNNTIDVFFNSLALDQGANAIGIILSGTGSDGTKGSRAIKEAGGYVLVQKPDTAKFDGMPLSAIASGYTDKVLTPSEMYADLVSYTGNKENDKWASFQYSEYQLQAILYLVLQRTGYDFRQYKQGTTLRRIERRVHINKFTSIEQYLHYLSQDNSEASLLAAEFFVRVTSFFRNQGAFEALYNDVILPLVKAKKTTEGLRIWVAPCCTGEEAYSIAIMVDKALQSENKILDVKIFASDIDKSAIGIASRGMYPASALNGMDESILTSYFTECNDGYHVLPRIRKQIVFTAHNLMKDPPFSNNDLVSCRNLLIYMNQGLQEKLLNTFAFSLIQGGYLFLGRSESVSGQKEFREVNNKWKIYQLVAHRLNRSIINRDIDPLPQKSAARINHTRPDIALSEDLRKVLIDEMDVAAVYVNDFYEIKEGVGAFRKYLGLPDRLNSMNLLRLAPKGLSPVLSNLLSKCQRELKQQVVENVLLKLDDKPKLVNIYAYPPSENQSRLYILIVFTAGSSKEAPAIDTAGAGDGEKNSYVMQLEDELRDAQLNLKAAIESLETANEELQSSNEELQSANEELQSSNEELQSLNEELHTLNAENQLRIKELSELNDDISNYQQTSPIGQVFLDNMLCIRRFNQAASKVINLIDSDIGRPIDHVTNYFKESLFLDDVRLANESVKTIERECTLKDGRISLVRISPYVKQDKKHDGIVITFIDITATVNLNTLIKSVFETSTSPIFVFKPVRDEDGQILDYTCTLASHSAYFTFGRQVQQERLSLRKDFVELATKNVFRHCKEVIDSGKMTCLEISFVKNEKKCWYLLTISKMVDACVWMLTDITDRMLAAEKLQQNFNELILTKESLHKLNLELEQKVKSRTQELQLSEERFRTIASVTSDIIWDWDLINNQIWWSESYCSILGYPSDNNPFSWFLYLHPEDIGRVKDAFKHFLHQSQSAFSITYRFRKSNGEYAFLLNRGTILSEHKMPYRIIGSIVDLTKLEESEQQLRQTKNEVRYLSEQMHFVSDFMPQIMWTANETGEHEFFNKRWFDYTGVGNGQLAGRDWWAVLHPDDTENARASWQQAIEKGSHYTNECRIKRHDGIYHWFLTKAQPMLDYDNRVIKWYGSCTDIDYQKSAESLLEEKVQERTLALKDLNEQLKMRNAELAEFASITSHDLKEPLRKIHLLCGLIESEYEAVLQGNLADYMGRISKASFKAVNMVNDILSFTRLSHKQLLEEVDMNLVVSEILSDLEMIIKEKNASIKVNELPVMVGVSARIRQLFQNLIANALKFHKPGQAPGISISCNELLVKTNGEHIPAFEIKIKDDGIGFNNNLSTKMFSLFQRLHGDRYEGTGIGLSVVKKIVEEHGGTIVAAGKEGEGAEFTITMPQNKPPFRDVGCNIG